MLLLTLNEKVLKFLSLSFSSSERNRVLNMNLVDYRQEDIFIFL
jgi:hypothetical protein